MDELKFWELNDIYQALPYSDVTTWETTRLLYTLIFNIMSKDKLTPQELMRLPWEEPGEEQSKELTADDVNRLKHKSLNIREALLKQNNGGSN